MKITKSRLLQIIREEVELHEKTLEENSIQLDEQELQVFVDADKNEDGELSKKESNKAISDEIKADEDVGLEEYNTQEEDRLFTKELPHEEIPPKNGTNKKLEIKIR
jgi:hypothetical protein